MRASVFLLIVLAAQIWAAESYSQATRLSLQMNDVRLFDVLGEIEAQTEFYFLLNQKLVDVERKVTIDVNQQKIEDILTQLFAGTNVNYLVMNRQIVLTTATPENLGLLKQPGTREITGTVTDSDGQPLVGVSVVVKGTTIGTISDINGKFSLSIPQDAEILIFSFVGMRTQEVGITDLTMVNVMLEQEVIGIEEVVAIGYGTQSKRFITGSISYIDMQNTENLPNTHIGQAMRGRVAGVQIIDPGRPGQPGSILIRGPRSLSAENAPLIILDNIYFNGSLSEINPSDIESLAILKDASAAAVYGSRAANGVILITSKKGKTEKPMINVNSSYGISNWAQQLKLLSAERYLERHREARRQLGIVFDPDNLETYLTLTEAQNYRDGEYINPYDMGTQQGQIFLTDISLSGRTNFTNYYLSTAVTNEKGLIYNDNFKRISLRANIENKITDWLTIGTNTMFSENDNSGVIPTWSSITWKSPFGTYYYDDGTPTQYIVPEDAAVSGNPLYNPYYRDNLYIKDNLFASFYSIFEIPQIKGLTFRTNYSHNKRWIRDYNVTRQDPRLSSNTTTASKRNWQANDWVVENILNYFFRLGNVHFFDITLMYGANENNSESTTSDASQLTSDIFGWNNLNIGENLITNSNAQKVTGISSMARLNYRLKNKYLLTLTGRRDGCSVFAKENKYGVFPSAAISWIASDEDFLRNISYLDFLKLRVSYGAVGNQAINPYQSLSLATTTRYVFGDGSPSYLGILPESMGNENLKWETTYTTNLTLEFEIFKRRIGGIFEIYNMDTKDLLVTRSLPIMTGYSSIWTNIGQVNNKGVEITLNTVNIQTGKFAWNSDIMFSYNENKIVSIYGVDLDGDGREDDDIGNRWFIGQPINIQYDYVFDGIYQEGDELPLGYVPGFARVKDLNGDGVINAAYDRKVLGQSSEPKFKWGITNTITAGNFELSIFVNAMFGWLGVFNELDHTFESLGVLRPANRLDAGWWTPENKSNTRPGFQYSRSTIGHNWYLSRDFIRIQDLTLSYVLPKNKIKTISDLSLYISGKNLLTITEWLGNNPEATTSSRYPLARTYSIGCKFGF